MKKLISLSIMVMIVISLLITACGGSTVTTTSSPTTTSSTVLQTTTTTTTLSTTTTANTTVNTGTPSIPHTLEGRSDCLSCHADNILADHAGRTSAMCTGCHSPK
jgi:hypothetical protein